MNWNPTYTLNLILARNQQRGYSKSVMFGFELPRVPANPRGSSSGTVEKRDTERGVKVSWRQKQKAREREMYGRWDATRQAQQLSLNQLGSKRGNGQAPGGKHCLHQTNHNHKVAPNPFDGTGGRR